MTFFSFRHTTTFCQKTLGASLFISLISMPLGGCIGSKIRVKDTNLDANFPSLHSVPEKPIENDSDCYADFLSEDEYDNESDSIFKAPHRNASGCGLAPSKEDINQPYESDWKSVLEKRTASPSHIQMMPNQIEPTEKPKQTKDYIQQNQDLRRKFGL